MDSQNKYQKTQIYKLYSPLNPTEVYIGATSNTLSKRLSKHKTNYRVFMEGYNISFCSAYNILDNMGMLNDDVTIELVEKFPCNTLQEKGMRERYWINEYKNKGYTVVNERVPVRTVREYQLDKYDELSKPIECECGGTYTKFSKSAHIHTKRHKKHFNIL